MSRGKFDGIPTNELFDAEPMRERKRRPKTIPSSAHGKCPQCTAEKVGLVRVGAHLVWRRHTYRTWVGTAVECPASGVTLCVAPEGRPPLNVHPIPCPCGGRP